MRLEWFSPLPPDHTEIGNVTARILPALAAAFEITVHTETRRWDPALEGVCPVRGFTAGSLDWKALNTGGLPVYHAGNNVHFHGETIRVARRCPGVVVLHDLALHETVANLCLLKGGGRAEYLDVLRRHGGAEAVALGRAYLEGGKVDADRAATAYPLHEYVLENAAGVIVHNPLNAEAARRCTPAPLLYAPLPFLGRAAMAPPRPPPESRGGPLRIVLFGFLGAANRRVRPFLEALAGTPARGRFTVEIAGTYPQDEVKRWIRELGLSARVRLHGYLPDAGLDRLLAACDLAVNLRWPSRGESSGTLLRAWNHSLPALVTDTAYYSTLPRDCAAFVRPDHEQADIRAHLEAFAAEPERYRALGRAGRAHLERQHAAEAFVAHLRAFLPEVMAWRGRVWPQLFGRALARDFLADYPAAADRPALLRRCAAEVAQWG